MWTIKSKARLLRKWKRKLDLEEKGLLKYDFLSSDFYSQLDNIALIKQIIKDLE